MKKFNVILWSITIIVLLLFVPVLIFFTGYLKKDEPVRANILIVEGWMPEYALELAADEFHSGRYDYLVTTGIKLPEYYSMYTNGFLIFPVNSSGEGVHEVAVKAFSPFDGNRAAHFRIWLNDSLLSEGQAGTEKDVQRFRWKGDLADIDSVSIQFDNDALLPEGDRNLYVYGLMIDGRFYSPYSEKVRFKRLASDTSYIERFIPDSYAEAARIELIDQGVEPDRIIAVSGDRIHRNRTFNSVVAFRNWLKDSEIEVEGINIISLGNHSRRTWLSYHKLLRIDYPLGVISLPDIYRPRKFSYAMKEVMRETAGYIWYRTVLIPSFKLKNKNFIRSE